MSNLYTPPSSLILHHLPSPTPFLSPSSLWTPESHTPCFWGHVWSCCLQFGPVGFVRLPFRVGLGVIRFFLARLRAFWQVPLKQFHCNWAIDSFSLFPFESCLLSFRKAVALFFDASGSKLGNGVPLKASKDSGNLSVEFTPSNQVTDKATIFATQSTAWPCAFWNSVCWTARGSSLETSFYFLGVHRFLSIFVGLIGKAFRFLRRMESNRD